MASIREKGPYQWAVQIRRKGWPLQSATFRTKKDAQAWARQIELAARAVGVVVHDHVIVGKERDASFRAMALL